MDDSITALSTSLHHVLFFLDNNQKRDQAPSPTDSTSSNDSTSTAATTVNSTADAQTPATTRASSPACQAQVTSGPKGATSPLNADTPAFVPLTAAANSMYEVRSSAGKGLGVFACRDIPRGTRIVCEAPLLEIPQHGLDIAYHEYLRLPADKKTNYDALHCYISLHVDYERVARLCALHYNVSEQNLPQYVSEHVRVMGIFACNDFVLANGNLGVFPICSRLNHSCVPNAHHTNNPVLGKQTIQTVRDVVAGEELLINYLGAGATYDLQHERLPKLGVNYGFECQCVACTDPTGCSDQRRSILRGIFWGLNEYQNNAPPDGHFIPNSPHMALAQAEDGIRFLIEEQLFSTELIKAYRVASGFALSIRDYERGLEYAFNEEEIERNILGFEVDDLEKVNVAAKQWVESVYLTAIRAGFNFKSSFLRQLPQRVQQVVQAMETKRMMTRGPMKRVSNQTLNKKKSFNTGKKKQNRSPRKQTQVQGEKVATIPTNV